MCLQTDFSLGALKSLKYVALKVWNIAPRDISNTNNLSDFNLKVKSWIPYGYPCD